MSTERPLYSRYQKNTQVVPRKKGRLLQEVIDELKIAFKEHEAKERSEEINSSRF